MDRLFDLSVGIVTSAIVGVITGSLSPASLMGAACVSAIVGGMLRGRFGRYPYNVQRLKEPSPKVEIVWPHQ